MEKEEIKLLVEGGKAAPDASSAPKLSAYKLNIGEVFKKINEKTADYKGMQVPVIILIDKATKSFEIKIGTPPVSSLIKKELGIEKAKPAAVERAEEEKKKLEGGEKPEVPEKEGEEIEEEKEPREEEEKETETIKEGEVVGNLTMKQVVKIAKMKRDDLLSKDLKFAVKQVVGTAGSMMGIRIEGKKPKEIVEDIDKGKYNHLLKD